MCFFICSDAFDNANRIFGTVVKSAFVALSIYLHGMLFYILLLFKLLCVTFKVCLFQEKCCFYYCLVVSVFLVRQLHLSLQYLVCLHIFTIQFQSF